MERATITDLAYIYHTLLTIKKPSPKVKEMMAKLEDHLHHAVMSLKKINSSIEP